jgi:hypothetical protein
MNKQYFFSRKREKEKKKKREANAGTYVHAKIKSFYPDPLSPLYSFEVLMDSSQSIVSPSKAEAL